MIRELDVVVMVLALSGAPESACGMAGVEARPSVQSTVLSDRGELEPAVAEHIRSLEEEVARLVRDRAPDEQTARAQGLLAQVYHAYALMEPAEAGYRAAHRLAPGDFRWPYLLAHLLQQQNRADEALSFFDRAQALRGDYAPLFVQTGSLHLAQNRLDEAVAAFEQALKLDASIAAARYGLGQVAMSRRDFAAAVDHLSRVLTDVPDATRVHYVLAMAYRGLGQGDQAEAHLRRQGPVGVRVADPLADGLADLVKGARLALVRGRLAFDAGRYREAADAYRTAVAAEPGSVPARVNLGTSLAQLGDAEGAITQFIEALERDPDNLTALYNLGVLYPGRGDPARGMAYLTRLVELVPGDHAARFALARVLASSGQLDTALANLTQVASAEPANEDYLLARVDVLDRLARHEDALAALEQAHKRFPANGRTAARLAYVLTAGPRPDLYDHGRALPLARQVYDATGTVGHGAVIAMALAGLGRCAEAVQWQEQLVARAEREEPRLVPALRADLERYQACR